VSEPVLRLRLSAGYGKATVLHDVCLDLREGDCLGLAGTSGAGKSTLVLALLGLLPWRRGWVRGEVLLHGKNLLALPEREARRVRGKEIALVPQSPLSALNPALSLQTQFREAWTAHESSRDRLLPRVTELLRRVQLPDDEAFLRRKPGEISVGQAQRVVLALALLHRPAVVVADEPTSALDPETQVEVLRLLRSLQHQERTTLLYISHDIVSILQLCQSVAVLQAGRIAAAQPVAELASLKVHPALQSLLATMPVPAAVLLQHLTAIT
jgi:peptide/nickel transport system ATP-binding protein